MRAPRRLASAPRSRLAVACALTLSSCGPGEEDFLSQVKAVEDIEEQGGNTEDGRWDLHKFLHPLDEPEWVSGASATHMRPDDPVVGYVSGGLAWALPWWVLKNHHVANLTLDAKPVCIVLCERCSSAAAWDPVVDGRRLRLRVNGVYDGTIVLIDEDTRTWWTPFLGEARSGPLKGKRLARLRIDQATWADWLELHPQSLVANGAQEMRLGHSEKEWPGAPWLGPTMRRSIRHPDDRLPMHELVLGVKVNGEARAYPMKTLDADGSFVEDSLGDEAIVVLHKPGTWLAAAFRRTLDGRKLEFVAGEDGAALDAGTRSRWNAAGVARTGPLEGKSLEPVTYGMEEWYVWATQHPRTSIHGERR